MDRVVVEGLKTRRKKILQIIIQQTLTYVIRDEINAAAGTKFALKHTRA